MNLSVPIGVAHHFRVFAEDKIKIVLKSDSELEYTKNIPPDTKLMSLNTKPLFKVSDYNFTISDISIIIWFTIVILSGTTILLWILHTKNHLKKCPPIERSNINELLKRKSKELGIMQELHLYYLDTNITDGPTVTGVFHPKIFLPRRFVEEWTVKDIEPILLHELVHIKHHDLLVNWLQIIFQVLFFFHPLVWYVNWKIRQIREEVCDDIAIQMINNKRKRYSHGILNVLEEIFHDPNFGLIGLGFSERKNSLAKRIIRITNRDYQFYKPMTAYSIVVLIVISALSIAIACDSTNNITGVVPTAEKTSLHSISPEQNPYLIVKIIKSGEYEVEGLSATSSDLAIVLKDVMNKYSNNKIVIQSYPEIIQKDIMFTLDTAYSVGATFVQLK